MILLIETQFDFKYWSCLKSILFLLLFQYNKKSILDSLPVYDISSLFDFICSCYHFFAHSLHCHLCILALQLWLVIKGRLHYFSCLLLSNLMYSQTIYTRAAYKLIIKTTVYNSDRKKKKFSIYNSNFEKIPSKHKHAVFW